MLLEARNFYVIRQSNGTLWNFTYKENFGIIYRTFVNNMWSTYNILVKNSAKAFSALILPDDRLCIIYQSISGNLLLKVYSDEEWNEYSILQKKGNNTNDIYFKTLYTSGKIHIFYSILQSKDNLRILFHQTLTIDNNFTVSSPKLIDTTNVNHINKFVINPLNNNTICIMYQKLVNKYELGYKLFQDNSSQWSKFYVVDKNLSPYVDYSLSSTNDKLNMLYIKNIGEVNALFNASGYLLDLEHIKLTENNNLISCALFSEKNITHNFWISNNSLYSCYSYDNGINISPIRSEGLKTSNIFKSLYLEISTESQYIINELYVEDDTALTLLPSNFLAYKDALKTRQNRANNKLVTDIYSNTDTQAVNKSLYSNAEDKMVNVEMMLTKKEQLIGQLNYIIKEEKNKLMECTNRISILEKSYMDNERQKSQLHKDISDLQEALISKESRINELEKMLIEKETKSINLNENLNKINGEYNKKIVLMESQVTEDKSMIESLNKTIESLNSQIHILQDENEKNIFLKNKIEEYKKLIENLNYRVSILQEENTKIELLESHIGEYRKIIENLNKIIEDLNSKVSVLEEEKAALINDKTNSSLFKKLFSSQ